MAETLARSELSNRCVYGKPTEHVELEQKEPETLEALDAMTREDRKQLLRQLEAQGPFPASTSPATELVGPTPSQ